MKRNENSKDLFADLALPKKVLASIENIPANTKKENLPKPLVRHLEKIIDDIGWDYGPHNTRVFAPLHKRARETFQGNSLAEEDRHLQEILRTVVRDNPTTSATVPIIWESPNREKAEQIGSGVLIQIVDEVFLLTAAHVLNFCEDGFYLIPSVRGYMPITGKCTLTSKSTSGRRSDDEFDIAFVWLDEKCVRRLDRDYLVLDRPDVFLEAPPERFEYTFAGFRWRKSRVTGRCIDTNLTTMSGIEAKRSEYDQLKLDPKFFIVMRFHRRRAFSNRLKKPIKGPLPDGMSGGGAYIWSEEALKNWPVRLPLAGIINYHLSDKNLLVATRLHVYIQWIFKKYPDLAAIADGSA